MNWIKDRQYLPSSQSPDTLLRVHTCVCVPSHFSRAWLSVTLWTQALRAPLSMGFFRQEYWVGCHALLQGIFPTQRSNLHLLVSCIGRHLYLEHHLGSPRVLTWGVPSPELLGCSIIWLIWWWLGTQAPFIQNWWASQTLGGRTLAGLTEKHTRKTETERNKEQTSQALPGQETGWPQIIKPHGQNKLARSDCNQKEQIYTVHFFSEPFFIFPCFFGNVRLSILKW